VCVYEGEREKTEKDIAKKKKKKNLPEQSNPLLIKTSAFQVNDKINIGVTRCT